jgi:hypothetical protein
MDLAKDQNANRTLSISGGIDHVIHIVQPGTISFHELEGLAGTHEARSIHRLMHCGGVKYGHLQGLSRRPRWNFLRSMTCILSGSALAISAPNTISSLISPN